MKLPQTPHVAIAGLAGLLVLVLAMFVAMLAGTEPHPPAARGPYFAAVAALALTSIWLLLVREGSGVWLGLLATLALLPSVGPHKFWTEPAAQALAPLILVGSSLIVMSFASLAGIVLRQGREEMQSSDRQPVS